MPFKKKHPQKKQAAGERFKTYRSALFWRAQMTKYPPELRREIAVNMHGCLMDVATVYVPQAVPVDQRGPALQAIMPMIVELSEIAQRSTDAKAKPPVLYVSELPQTLPHVG